MEANESAIKWIATQLAWEARLDELRQAFADKQGWEDYPVHGWDERVAA